MSLTDINARLSFIQTGTTDIQLDMDKVHMYLDYLATHTVSPLLLLPSTLRKVLVNIKKGMTAYSHLVFTK